MSAVAAGALFAAAVLTKLVPLLALPPLLGLAGRRRAAAFLVAAVAAASIMTAPFLPEIEHMCRTLSAYARHWEFAGAAFRVLRRVTGSGDLARLLLAAAFLGASAWTFSRGGDRHPLLGALRRCYAIVLALLLCSPTLHPWYALYLAALLPACAGPFGLALSASVFFGYGVVARYATSGAWVESDRTAIAIVLVPLCVLFLTRALSRRRGHEDRPGPDDATPPAR
jgi:hypothetical protein